MDDENSSIKPDLDKPDLDGDTEMAMIDDFGATEVGFLTPAGDVEGIDGVVASAASLEVALDAVTEPVGASSRSAAIAAAIAADALAEDVAVDPHPDGPRAPVTSATPTRPLPRAVLERPSTVDAAAERLASADSVIERLASAFAASERLANADSAIERLAGADSSISFRAISDSVAADEEKLPRSTTAEFWPPPGPLPAGTHGPRRQARMFAAVEEETRDWLDSDQVTVVPSPDDL